MKKDNDFEVFTDSHNEPEVFSFPESDNLKQIPDENYVFNSEENASQSGSDNNSNQLGNEDNTSSNKKKNNRQQERNEDRSSNNNNNSNSQSSSSSSSSSGSAGGSASSASSVAGTAGSVASVVASTAVVAVVAVVGGGIVMDAAFPTPEVVAWQEVYTDENKIGFSLLIKEKEDSEYAEDEKETDAVVELTCPLDSGFYQEFELKYFGIRFGEFSDLKYDTEYVLNVYRPTMLGADREYLIEEGYSITTPKKGEEPGPEPEPEIIDAEEVLLSSSSLELYVGDTHTLEATVLPENTTDKTITWTSSNEEVATVDISGIVTAVGVGDATIYATCGEVYGWCSVDVSEPPEIHHTESVTLDVHELTIEAQTSTKLNATILPEDTVDSVLWTSSDPHTVAVEPDGTIYPLVSSETPVVITVKSGDYSDSCYVTVTPPITHVTAVHITNSDYVDYESIEFDLNVSTYLNVYYYLEPTIGPADNAADFSIEDETVAEITQYAHTTNYATIHALKEGTTNLIVRSSQDPEVFNSVPIIVTNSQEEVHTQDISLSENDLNLLVGEISVLTASVYPEDSVDPIEWTSSNTFIATVANGVVTAINAGSATITAASGGHVASCLVTVTAAPHTQGIQLDVGEISLEIEETHQLEVTLTPSDSVDGVTFSSNNPEVATVSDDGLITAVGVGEATITVTSGGQEALCFVYVDGGQSELTSLEFIRDGFSLAMEGYEPDGYVTPNVFDLLSYEPNDGGHPNVTFQCTDYTVLSIDSDGTMHALKEGSVQLIATCGELSDVCTVAVKIFVTEFYLGTTTVHYNVGDVFHIMDLGFEYSPLQASVTPSDFNLIHDSGDAATSYDSNSDTVTCTTAGHEVISIRLGYADPILLTVYVAESTESGPTVLELNETEGTIHPAQAFSLVVNVGIGEEELVEHGFTWTVADPNNAVSYNLASATYGNDICSITGVGAGTAVFVCFYDLNDNGILDEGEKSATCVITVQDSSSSDAPFEINLSIYNLVMTLGSEPESVNASMSPDTEDFRDVGLTWVENPNAVAEIEPYGNEFWADAAMITPKGEGQTTFTCFYDSNGNGELDEDEPFAVVTVTVNPSD